MEEIQKNARALYRLFVLVCCVIFAVGLENPDFNPSNGALDELKLLRSIDWAAYSEHLERTPGNGRLRPPTESATGTEKEIARVLTSRIPGLENPNVLAPSVVLGVDKRAIEELVASGKISEYEEFLRANEGAHLLEYSAKHLYPDHLVSELKGLGNTSVAFNAANGVALPCEVAYTVQGYATRTSPDIWNVDVSVAAKMLPPGGKTPQVLTPRAISGLSLRSKREYAAGTQVQTWLSTQYEKSHLILGKNGPFPKLRERWSLVGDLTLSEALAQLESEQREKAEADGHQSVPLLNIPIVRSALPPVGAVFCLALLLVRVRRDHGRSSLTAF